MIKDYFNSLSWIQVFAFGMFIGIVLTFILSFSGIAYQVNKFQEEYTCVPEEEYFLQIGAGMYCLYILDGCNNTFFEWADPVLSTYNWTKYGVNETDEGPLGKTNYTQSQENPDIFLVEGEA